MTQRAIAIAAVVIAGTLGMLLILCALAVLFLSWNLWSLLK